MLPRIFFVSLTSVSFCIWIFCVADSILLHGCKHSHKELLNFIAFNFHYQRLILLFQLGESQGGALIGMPCVKCSPLTNQTLGGSRSHVGRCHVDRGGVSSSQEYRVLANNPTLVTPDSTAATMYIVVLSTDMLVSMLESRKEELWFSVPPFLLLEQSQQVFIESCSRRI